MKLVYEMTQNVAGRTKGRVHKHSSLSGRNEEGSLEIKPEMIRQHETVS